MGGAAPIELLTPDEMATADRLAIEAGTSGYALMERAGAAIADAALRMGGEGPILVLAGPGNNGGDGLVAASMLLRAGRDVRVALLGDVGRLAGDAARAAASYRHAVEAMRPDMPLGAGLIVDALFGAGLSRPLEGNAAACVAAVNASEAPVLAVDLPSGVDGRSGATPGEAVRATRTVTFFRLKPGHLLLPGRGHCGEIELADIGIDAAVLDAIRPRTFHNLPALWRGSLRGPRPDDHKYSRGHAIVLSGPAHSTGAARLAALAALRVGAGAVTVASPPDAVIVNAAHLTAIMVRPVADATELARLLAERRAAAAVVGPGNGVGATTRACVEAALAGDAALVLDADALTSFADDRARLFGAIRERAALVVTTPHEGEFARLFGQQGGARIDRARAAAAESDAIVVLKGSDTIIADPDGRAAINANAPPELATAGSGDVLAGMIAGLLAQGLPGFEAAAAAVWMHGEAGRAVGVGLIAEDLPGAIPKVLKELASLSAGSGRH